MLRKKDDVTLEDFKQFGFKYGTRDRFLYKTKTNGLESMLYISLLPCHNNHNELKIDLEGRYIPDKIINKIYDLIQARTSRKGIGGITYDKRTRKSNRTFRRVK